MLDSLIRSVLTTTLATTELVLTRSLEAVQMVNKALGEPLGHEHESHRALKRDTVVQRAPSWRPPELGDLDATAAALATRSRGGPSVTPAGSVRPPRAAVRRPATRVAPVPDSPHAPTTADGSGAGSDAAPSTPSTPPAPARRRATPTAAGAAATPASRRRPTRKAAAAPPAAESVSADPGLAQAPRGRMAAPKRAASSRTRAQTTESTRRARTTRE